jgi:hypothetical protein
MRIHGLTVKAKALSAVGLACIVGALVQRTWEPLPAWPQESRPTEEVLKTLERAFDSKDLGLYASVLSGQYQFISACSTPEGAPVPLDRDYELEIIRRLFANYSTIDARFSVESENTGTDRAEANVRFSLLLVDHKGDGQRFEVTAQVVVASSTDGWRIVSWIEEPSAGPDGCSSPWHDFRESLLSTGESESVVNGTSWGGLKRFFKE